MVCLTILDYLAYNERFHGVVGYHMCFTYTGSPVRTRVEPFLYSEPRGEYRRRKNNSTMYTGKGRITLEEGKLEKDLLITRERREC